jgi:hypothetical protein
MATTIIHHTNNNKKIPFFKFDEYYSKGWRWCRICEIWFPPEAKAIFCKECKKLTRHTIKNKTKKNKKNNNNKQNVIQSNI